MEKLKNGTEIRYGTLDLKVVERMFSRDLTIEEKNGRKFAFSAYGWINTKFEILSEEDEERDIDKITEIYINNIKSVGESETKCWTGRNLDVVFANKLNELIKGLKQLDKK